MNFILLHYSKKKPIDFEHIENNSPLRRYTIDSSFRGNNCSGNNNNMIIDSRNLTVHQKDCNTFTLEDVNYRTLQRVRIVYEIEVLNNSNGLILRQILGAPEMCT